MHRSPRGYIDPDIKLTKIFITGLDLGAQLQYLACFGPDTNLGATLVFLTVGHRF